MTKYDLFSDLLASLLNNPIGFLVSFIMLAVPSGTFLWLLIGGTVAENTGHGIIGGLLLFVYNAYDKITLFIFETFIDLVVHAVVVVIVISSILSVITSILASTWNKKVNYIIPSSYSSSRPISYFILSSNSRTIFNIQKSSPGFLPTSIF